MLKKLVKSKSRNKGVQWAELRMRGAWAPAGRRGGGGEAGEGGRGPGAWRALVGRAHFATDARAVTGGS